MSDLALRSYYGYGYPSAYAGAYGSYPYGSSAMSPYYGGYYGAASRYSAPATTSAASA